MGFFFSFENIRVFDAFSGSLHPIWSFRISIVYFDLYFFCFGGNTQLSLQNETLKTDWKLLGQGLWTPGFRRQEIGRGTSHFISSPNANICSLGLFTFSGEESIHSRLPEFLKWSKERNLGRTSRHLLSDFYWIHLFLTVPSAIPVSLIPEYLQPISLNLNFLFLSWWCNQMTVSMDWQPDCPTTLFRLLAMFSSLPLSPHPVGEPLGDSLEQMSSLS